MAKKAPKRSAKTSRASGNKFSVKALHSAFTKTLKRLNKQPKTKKRDELIGLITKMQRDADCPQNMAFPMGN